MARRKAFDELEVLDKAVELFWTKGYAATSADDLVKGLGISRSSLYDTFGGKRLLFTKALNRYREMFVANALKMVAESDDLVATMGVIFRMVVDQDITSPIPKGCLMVNTSIELGPHDSEILAIVRKNTTDIENAFELAIQKGQTKSQITKAFSAKTLAHFLSNHLSGLRVTMKSEKDRSVLEDSILVSLSVLN